MVYFVQLSVAAGQKNDQFNQKETLKKRITNIEQGIKNIEVRYSTIIIFKKRLSDLSGRSRRRSLKRFHTSSFEISCSIFCGSLFQLCVVSHEELGSI